MKDSKFLDAGLGLDAESRKTLLVVCPIVLEADFGDGLFDHDGLFGVVVGVGFRAGWFRSGWGLAGLIGLGCLAGLNRLAGG